jgi:transcriptional antiterminator NusG
MPDVEATGIELPEIDIPEAVPAEETAAAAPAEPIAEQPASGDFTLTDESGEDTEAEIPEAEAPLVEEAPSAKEAPPAKPRKAKAAAPKRTKKPAATILPDEPKSDKMDWFILKVQSNREESIREGLLRRVAIAGFGRFFGDVIVPTEKVTEFKGGKKKIIKRKLYPGYLVVQMEINEETWFLVRETPGIGDFTGAGGHPTPMLPHEVNRILAKAEEKTDEAPKLKIGCKAGDRVKINEGTFANFEGEVESIDQTNGRVTVMINIFGRSTPVELEYWQIESI